MSAERKVIASPKAAQQFAGKTVSPAVRGGDFVFVAGLMAQSPGTVVSELKEILETLKGLLEDAGTSLGKVVKVNIFLYSMLEMPNVDPVYKPYFPEDPPARTICGTRIPDGFKVVLECTALA
jgi:2-iminobutanoate/2-iminopropanoate deaminase